MRIPSYHVIWEQRQTRIKYVCNHLLLLYNTTSSWCVLLYGADVDSRQTEQRREKLQKTTVLFLRIAKFLKFWFALRLLCCSIFDDNGK